MKNIYLSKADEAAFKVLRKLEHSPTSNQRELAQVSGLSLGGLNYCLRALINKGFVKAHNFSASKNKLGYAYLLTPEGLAEKIYLTKAFLKRKQEEYTEIQKEIDQLGADMRKDALNQEKS